MDCSAPGFPVHHQLLELARTHVHWVGNAIQPSQPLSSPSPLPSIFPNIKVFSHESVLRIRWPKYRSFSFSIRPSSEYSGLICNLKRTDLQSYKDWFAILQALITFPFDFNFVFIFAAKDFSFFKKNPLLVLKPLSLSLKQWIVLYFRDTLV